MAPTLPKTSTPNEDCSQQQQQQHHQQQEQQEQQPEQSLHQQQSLHSGEEQQSPFVATTPPARRLLALPLPSFDSLSRKGSPKLSKYPLKSLHFPRFAKQSIRTEPSVSASSRQEPPQPDANDSRTATTTRRRRRHSMGNQICTDTIQDEDNNNNAPTTLLGVRKTIHLPLSPRGLFAFGMFHPNRETEYECETTSQDTKEEEEEDEEEEEEEKANTSQQQQQRERQKKNPLLRWLDGVGHTVMHFVDHVLLAEGDDGHSQEPPPRRVLGGILLHGCNTPEQHFARHDAILQQMQSLHGLDGLMAAGLFYKRVPCPKHQPSNSSNNNQCTTTEEEEPFVIPRLEEATFSEHDDDDDETGSEDSLLPNSMSHASSLESTATTSADGGALKGEACTPITTTTTLLESVEHCDDCQLRLCHMESQTLVSNSNRRQFVTDGAMYDEVSRCCMEYAQQLMTEEGDLVWTTIDDTTVPPVCALVSRTLLDQEEEARPTLLVITGRGKVRAGIFSRRHLQGTGLEPSCALSIVGQAKRRNMNVILLDPNVHGERKAMGIVEKSMAHFFQDDDDDDTNEKKKKKLRSRLYVQAHSCAGSYVVRHLMDWYDYYAPFLGAMVFTDSTHSIQWLQNSTATPVCARLKVFLESPHCVYFRSSKDDDKHEAGEECPKDVHWQHRFGTTATYWAGTTEHSLSDWHARRFIWQHLDSH